MHLLDSVRALIACSGICLIGAAASCSSADAKRSQEDSSTVSDGGHGAAEGDAAPSHGSGGSEGRAGGGRGSGGKALAGTGGATGVPDDGSPGTEPTPDASGGGSTTPPGSGGAGRACSAIVSCIGACADDACVQACIDQGSPTAQDLVNAFLDCADINGCTDAACLQMNCASEDSACKNDRPSSGAKDSGGPPAGGGAIPADLIGNWANSDQSVKYQFNADGTYEYVFHYNSSLTCLLYLSQLITETGQFSVNGDTLTTMGMSRTTMTQECNYHSSTDMDSGAANSYRYTLSGGTLNLTDSKGNTSTLTQQ